jgi:hypothetical protein
MHDRNRPTVLRNRPLSSSPSPLSRSLTIPRSHTRVFPRFPRRPVAPPRNGAKSEVEAWNWWASALHSSPLSQPPRPIPYGKWNGPLPRSVGTAPTTFSLPLFAQHAERDLTPRFSLRMWRVATRAILRKLEYYAAVHVSAARRGGCQPPVGLNCNGELEERAIAPACDKVCSGCVCVEYVEDDGCRLVVAGPSRPSLARGMSWRDGALRKAISQAIATKFTPRIACTKRLAIAFLRPLFPSWPKVKNTNRSVLLLQAPTLETPNPINQTNPSLPYYPYLGIPW